MTLDRRKMLQSALALSAATLVSNAESQPTSSQPVSRLQSLAGVSVTREEVSEIPGGKEYFYEWTLKDDAGTVETTRAHHVRVDTPVTYSMTTQISTTRISSGGKQSLSSHNISVSGVKGEVSNGARRDHVTITAIAPDGEISRTSKEVSVRVDMPEIQGLSTEETIKFFGNKFLQGGAK